MFIQRALVTFTLGPLGLLLIYLGGWFYFLPIVAILAIATFEYASLMRRLGWRPSLWLLLPAAAGQWIAGEWPQLNLYAPLMMVSLLAVMVYVLWLYERRLSETVLVDWLVMMGGILLLGWIGAHFFRLRNVESMAWQWTALAIASTWIADSAAYVAGKRWGKHKLAPRLSPNKTVEGYVAGLVVGTLFAVVLAVFLKLPLFLSIVVGLLVSGVSPAGDLGMSLLKREAGVKDSGHLLPGHGGALDRVDSLVWSVTMAYYLVVLFAH